MKIFALSDTHNNHYDIEEIPECDLLIHAGDVSTRGSPEELLSFLDWFGKQKAKYKVMIPGNHDWGFEKDPELWKRKAADRGISLLIEELIEVDGLKIYGTPITPYFCNWAFNRWPGPEIQAHWDKIQPCDILITHGPPYQILDENGLMQNCGCNQLLDKILEIKPKVHIFGHIHENFAMKEFMGIKFYNVAMCSNRNALLEKPMEIIL
jgi:Icc-related predicted phosphoesterase